MIKKRAGGETLWKREIGLWGNQNEDGERISRSQPITGLRVTCRKGNSSILQMILPALAGQS